MPFKSEAQRRKFYAMANRGEISKHEVSKWEKATGKKKLPERLHKKGEMMFRLAMDLGKLAALRNAGLDKNASLLESLGFTGLKTIAPLLVPAAAGAIIGGPDRRIEGAVAGGIGGMLGSRLLRGHLSRIMSSSPAVQKALHAADYDVAKAFKSLAADPRLQEELLASSQRAAWAGRLGGGAAGGYAAQKLMSPGMISDAFSSMPKAQYDVGGHYSGAYPEDSYEYGLL